LTNNIINMTVILLIVCVIILIYLLNKHNNAANNDMEAHIVRDTIVKLVPAKPLVITKVKTRIIKLSDTVICYHPFRAEIDTIIQHDTIRSYYKFPNGFFSLRINRHSDTMMTERAVVYRIKQTKEKWWEKPLMVLGGVLAGYTIGRVR